MLKMKKRKRKKRQIFKSPISPLRSYLVHYVLFGPLWFYSVYSVINYINIYNKCRITSNNQRKKKITTLFIFGLYLPRKNHIPPLYLYSYANVVFMTKLKALVLLLLKELYVIFINFKRYK